jgi:hypothetical protein
MEMGDHSTTYQDNNLRMCSNYDEYASNIPHQMVMYSTLPIHSRQADGAGIMVSV